MIDHVYRTAQQLSDNIIISCGQQPIESLAARQVVDSLRASGPLAGICALLQATKTRWLLTIPVDMPMMQPETLRFLIKNRKTDRPVACYGDARRQPLLAVWPQSLAAQLPDIIDDRNHCMIDLLEQLNCHYISPDSRLPAVVEFCNINRKNDLQQLISLLGDQNGNSRLTKVLKTDTGDA